MKTLHKNQRGFTLIEMIIVIVLVGIITIGAVRILTQGLLLYLTEASITDNLSQMVPGLERMEIDIRNLRSAGDIVTSTSTEFSFTDINDNAWDYRLSGSNLLCNDQVTVGNVSSFAFTYYDKNGNSTSTPANIRYIRYTITTVANASSITITSTAWPRELLS